MTAMLGVNIDHVATLRQARGVRYPDPVAAASAVEMAGADQVTCHIRMDRRHIQERDLRVLAETVQTRLNVEMAATDEMMAIAAEIRPHQVTLVPEREGEVTTEGGLDLRESRIREATALAVQRLQSMAVEVAIFVDPDPEQVEYSHAIGATRVELNTAAYAEATNDGDRDRELERIESASDRAKAHGLHLAAGHGLHYHNISALVGLGCIEEFNIGHAIVARSVFSGIAEAVRDMKVLIELA